VRLVELVALLTSQRQLAALYRRFSGWSFRPAAAFDIASVVERAEHQHAFEYFADFKHSTLMLYRTTQLEYKPAKYLSVVNCASHRRLISSFRTGCHDLRVDTGRWAGGVHLQ